MSAIRDVITDTLRSHGLITQNYTEAIDTVTEALEARAHIVVDAIVDRAQYLELGVSEYEVRIFLAALGLPSRPEEVEPQPEPEPEYESPLREDSVEARIARMEHTIVLLAAGVEKLTRLAEQHLGVSEPDDVQS